MMNDEKAASKGINMNDFRIFRQLPYWLKKPFEDRDIDIENILCCEYSDMDENDNLVDVWMAFDRELLYIFKGQEKIKEYKEKSFIEFKIFDFIQYPLDSFKSFELDKNVYSGRFLATKNDGTIIKICSFSMSCSGRIGRFSDNLNTYLKGEDPSQDPTFHSRFCPICGRRYANAKKAVCSYCKDTRSSFLRILSFAKDYKWQIFVFFLFIVLSSVFTVISPYVSSKMLYDDVLKDTGTTILGHPIYGEILFVLILIIAIRIISHLTSIIRKYVTAKIVPKMIYDIKMKIFSSMQKLSYGFYSSKQTGNLMERVISDASNVYWFFENAIPTYTFSLLKFVTVLVIMFIMNWQMSLIVLLAIPVSFITQKQFIKAFYINGRGFWYRQAHLKSHLSDVMSGQRVIKAFGKEKAEAERFEKMSDDELNMKYKIDSYTATRLPFNEFIIIFFNTLILGMGSIMIVTGYGDLSFGSLMTFTAYMNMLYEPVRTLSNSLNDLARSMDSSQRIFEVIDSEPDVHEAVNPLEMDDIKGDITLNDIYFEYEVGRPIIKGINAEIKAGQMLGIVGKTGAGKSTLANLIVRLYDVRKGSILIDGTDIRDISFRSLKKNIGIVSQEIYLFIGTIADNIRYVKPDASTAEIIAAAKAASAHDFIMNLPDGYETRIGTGGHELSGGEKQRISIARTIIQNPKILILDEATASMDTETEKKIQDSVNNLKSGRTTIAIAHRLATLRDADYIAVIDDGRMVQYGTHDQLLEQDGIYKKLYDLQQQALKQILIAE